MIINVLNFGVKVFMVDFEDFLVLSFCNQFDGQINLCDVVNGLIVYILFEGKCYQLVEQIVVLVVCLCGWYLFEWYVLVDGEVMVGVLVDFGLFVFYNVYLLYVYQCGLFFYLFKFEVMEEVVLWDDVMVLVENEFDLLIGCMKVIVLIEMLLVVFQMYEILYVLCCCVVGFNCGCWDYIFFYFKILCGYCDWLLFECGQVQMMVLFLKVYLEFLIQICYCCGVFVMGGMVVQILIKGDEVVNEVVMVKVCVDKFCEVQVGYDGIWVVYLVLVLVVQVIFDEYMFVLNQFDCLCEDVCVMCEQLFVLCVGLISCVGFDNNVEVVLCYIVVWLDGLGCVLIYYLMEDVVIVEIVCVQLWQWLYYGGVEFIDYVLIDFVLFDQVLVVYMYKLCDSLYFGVVKVDVVVVLLLVFIYDDQFVDFFILFVYQQFV